VEKLGGLRPKFIEQFIKRHKSLSCPLRGKDEDCYNKQLKKLSKNKKTCSITSKVHSSVLKNAVKQ
jgi:hypothetical protein